MVTYRVHQKQISDLLQVQFIFENSPIFAGTNDLSLLIRFKYTGDISKSDAGIQLQDPFAESNINGKTNEQDDSSEIKTHTEKVQKNDSSDAAQKDTTDGSNNKNESWFGSRLSAQLSNATRNIFLQSLSDVQEEEDHMATETSKLKEKQDSKVSLLLGYGQILGYYSINESIIDYSIFKEMQSSTIIEGKYAGINGLTAPTQNELDNENNVLFNALNSLYNVELNAITESNLSDYLKFIPFYSSNQNIIFGELEFDPEAWKVDEPIENECIKSFYINCRLPKDLPPTHFTEALQINYNFVLGYQIIEGSDIISKTVFVPLKIQPFIDNYGRQPIYHLQYPRLNCHLDDLVIADVSDHPLLIKSSDKPSSTSTGKRISFWNIKKHINQNNQYKSRKSSLASSVRSRRKSAYSINSISSDYVVDDEIADFLETLGSLDDADVNDIVKIQEQFEKKMNESNSFEFNVRENLIQIMANYKSVQRQKPSREYDDEFEYDFVLPKEQQTRFLIKQDNGLISTVSLNRGIFKLGDLINLNLCFENSKYETKGVEIQLLKQQIFYRDEYLKRNNYGDVSSRLTSNNILETVLYEKLLSTFDATSINHDVLIPVEAEPQFKTNFFTVKYYLQIRFIIVDSYNQEKRNQKNTENQEESSTEEETEFKKEVYDLKNIFIDGTGSILFRATENLTNANEFYVRIPVIILPTYEQDFGLFTTKM